MIDLIVDVLAVHRLTRLIVDDTLTQEPRERVIAHAYGADIVGGLDGRVARMLDDAEQNHLVALDASDYWQQIVGLDEMPPKLATLVTCRWCASVWVGLAVVVVRRRRWWRPLATALALSSASTMLVSVED